MENSFILDSSKKEYTCLLRESAEVLYERMKFCFRKNTAKEVILDNLVPEF